MSDLISRSALLAEIKKAYEHARLYPTIRTNIQRKCDYAEMFVENAPAVDAEPVRHGEWLLRHVGHGHYWECSACRTNPCIYVTPNTKFCPNCGAKMDAEVVP